MGKIGTKLGDFIIKTLRKDTLTIFFFENNQKKNYKIPILFKIHIASHV